MGEETLDAALGAGQSAKAGLFRKLAEVMGEVGRVEKRGRNQHFKYDYVTEADLVEAVSGKLAARSVAVVPSVVNVTERPAGNATVTTILVDFTFCDGDTGATVTARGIGSGSDNQDKGAYKAMTGATKYALMKMFLIATGDDPEADHQTDERASAPSRPQASPGRPASEKQQQLRAKLLDEKKPTVAQIGLMLNSIGVEDRPADPDGLREFVNGLDGARTSALIEQLIALPVAA